MSTSVTRLSIPSRTLPNLLGMLSCIVLGTRFLSAGDVLPIPPSHRAPDTCVAKPASSRIVNVRAKAYGAMADGRDDTAAIQKALDAIASTGGTVLIPEGTYMVNAIRNADGGNHGLAVKSNTTLRLAPGAILKAFPNGAPGYAIVRVANARNVNIIGGTIEGDRSTHAGNEGQWGMGVSLLNARDVVVEGITAKECWGDGFYVGGAVGCSNVTFCNVTAERNRRQGLAIISVDGLVVRASTFRNTTGYLENGEAVCGSGIDIEPNLGQTAANIRIEGSTFVQNAAEGLAIGPAVSDRGRAFVTNVVVDGNAIRGNGLNGLPAGITISNTSGHQLINNTIKSNFGIGISLRNEANENLVKGNTVTSTKAAASQGYIGYGILLYKTTGNIVTGNTITDSAACGIRDASALGVNTIGPNLLKNNRPDTCS